MSRALTTSSITIIIFILVVTTIGLCMPPGDESVRTLRVDVSNLDHFTRYYSEYMRKNNANTYREVCVPSQKKT